jgi:hypothetical protein
MGPLGRHLDSLVDLPNQKGDDGRVLASHLGSGHASTGTGSGTVRVAQ